MADQDLSHTADIIKAAIPFVDTKLKGMAELFAKLLDLMGSFKLIGKSSNLVALGQEAVKMDVEGLLKGIRPICNVKEREIVDRILNIFNMKRTFEMYNNMMSAMKTMQDLGGFNFGDFSKENDAENVTNNFTSPNFESIFQSFSNFNFSGDTNSSSSDTGNSSINSEPETPMEEIKEEPPKQDTESASSSTPFGSGFNMNNPMFEMLKTMIPPEQMGTFENLSMLFNTMSYDNNKSDDNKEHENG